MGKWWKLSRKCVIKFQGMRPLPLITPSVECVRVRWELEASGKRGNHWVNSWNSTWLSFLEFDFPYWPQLLPCFSASLISAPCSPVGLHPHHLSTASAKVIKAYFLLNQSFLISWCLPAAFDTIEISLLKYKLFFLSCPNTHSPCFSSISLGAYSKLCFCCLDL